MFFEFAPGVVALLQVLLHDSDVSEWTVACWEVCGAATPAVIVVTEKLSLRAAGHIAEGRLHEATAQKPREHGLQT